MDDHSRPVTGYPATAGGYPQHSYNNPNSAPPAGTAYGYVYAAPPPQAAAYYNQNPYYAAPDPAAAQRSRFLRLFFTLIIAIAIITGSITFITWLVLRPRIPEFRVDSVALSNFSTSSSSQVTGNWDVRFTVQNPNHKMIVFYDNIRAGVLYKDELISETSAPPFFQGKKSETTIGATFAASNTYVERKAVDRINSDRTSGSVKFRVGMETRVRFKSGSWRGRGRYMRIVCDDLSVGISSNSNGGSLMGGPKKCKVRL